MVLCAEMNIIIELVDSAGAAYLAVNDINKYFTFLFFESVLSKNLKMWIQMWLALHPSITGTWMTKRLTYYEKSRTLKSKGH